MGATGAVGYPGPPGRSIPGSIGPPGAAGLPGIGGPGMILSNNFQGMNIMRGTAEYSA